MKVLADIDWVPDKFLEDNDGTQIFTVKLRPFKWPLDCFGLKKKFALDDGCELTVDVDINMERLSGKSIVELLDEARNDNAKNGQP